jgi:hypothetical protein
LCLNIKHDDEAIIREKIRKFQLAFFYEYFKKCEEINWHTVSSDIMYRKDAISNAIKKSLGKHGKKHKELVDALLEKSWDEIFASFGKQTGESAPTILPAKTNQTAESPDIPDVSDEFEDAEEFAPLDEVDIHEESGDDGIDGLIELKSTELDASFFFNTDLFFQNVEPIELLENTDIIVENGGLYTIPRQAALAEVAQDRDFKRLVESVMR